MSTKNVALTRVQQQSKQLQGYLSKQKQFLQSVVADTIDINELIRWNMLVWRGNKQLQACSPESILLSLVAIGQWGLKPNPYNGEAYIVPFKGKATPMPGYKGLMKLARRAGIQVRGAVVYRNDEISIVKGNTESVEHHPALCDPGEWVGAYAVAMVPVDGPDGRTIEPEVCWMTRADIEYIRDQAPSGKSDAWTKYPTEMARKTALRRLCKTLPLGDDYFRAAAIDSAIATGDLSSIPGVIDVEVPPMFTEPVNELSAEDEQKLMAEFDRLKGLIEEANAPADYAKLISPIDAMPEPFKSELGGLYLSAKSQGAVAQDADQ